VSISEFDYAVISSAMIDYYYSYSLCSHWIYGI